MSTQPAQMLDRLSENLFLDLLETITVQGSLVDCKYNNVSLATGVLYNSFKVAVTENASNSKMLHKSYFTTG